MLVVVPPRCSVAKTVYKKISHNVAAICLHAKTARTSNGICIRKRPVCELQRSSCKHVSTATMLSSNARLQLLDAESTHMSQTLCVTLVECHSHQVKIRKQLQLASQKP